MDPIEIKDWLRANTLTQRTTDAREVTAHATGLPRDYPWLEPDAALLRALSEGLASNAS